MTKTEPVDVEPLEIELDAPAVAEPSPSELPAIARLGRYELLGRIAVGGMAEIYLARERFRSLGSRQLVVKVMRHELEGQAEFHTMFLHESRVALRLQHPNICHVYECGIAAGRCFIAMEHVRGITWRELQKRSALLGERVPVPVVVKIAAQVAEALHSAHHAKDADGRPLCVVHRDVSPQNVMIAFDGVVKLLDFGVAHARTDLTFERSGTIQGKFGYLAPEQCLGRPADARSDVFALGVCLWEALTGRRLYKRAGDYETLNAIVHEDAPDPNEHGARVPGTLVAIVRRALERVPELRFSTAGEMQHALERYLTDTRELVTTGRIAEAIARFADRTEPELDRRPAVVAWIPKEAPSAPQGRRRRMPIVVASGFAAVCALSAGAFAWSAGGGEEDEEGVQAQPEPVETPSPVPVVPVVAPAAPTPASAEVRAAPECPGGASAVGVNVAAECAAPTQPAPARDARSRRRGPRPGGFVDDPGF